MRVIGDVSKMKCRKTWGIMLVLGREMCIDICKGQLTHNAICPSDSTKQQ